MSTSSWKVKKVICQQDHCKFNSHHSMYTCRSVYEQEPELRATPSGPYWRWEKGSTLGGCEGPMTSAAPPTGISEVNNGGPHDLDLGVVARCVRSSRTINLKNSDLYQKLWQESTLVFLRPLCLLLRCIWSVTAALKAWHMYCMPLEIMLNHGHSYVWTEFYFESTGVKKYGIPQYYTIVWKGPETHHSKLTETGITGCQNVSKTIDREQVRPCCETWCPPTCSRWHIHPTHLSNTHARTIVSEQYKIQKVNREGIRVLPHWKPRARRAGGAAEWEK